ncbi:unnamed protein product [Phytophthora fragariaefolia]|uniref:Unnamed protein product n=1 Tax=Phytophthora fragariaefolia TaxID=1490495 RepID=A0A9W6XCR0_9STRA|nr:unnamed protein product [Phytophthora fragariaefolia]
MCCSFALVVITLILKLRCHVANRVNPRARNPSPPASREELDQASRSLSSDSMAYRNYGHNNNHQDMEDPVSYGNDALDNLSRRYPKKAPPTPQQQMASLNVTPLEPGMLIIFLPSASTKVAAGVNMLRF